MKMLADLPTSVPELQALVLEESAQLSALQEEYGWRALIQSAKYILYARKLYGKKIQAHHTE
jgi:hypothetical protein